MDEVSRKLDLNSVYWGQEQEFLNQSVKDSVPDLNIPIKDDESFGICMTAWIISGTNKQF